MLVAAGVWYVDRSWDQKGSAAYYKAAQKAATDAPGRAGVAGATAPSSVMRQRNSLAVINTTGRVQAVVETVTEEGAVRVPTSELDAAFPFPKAFLIGWGFLATSYLFDSNVALPDVALDLTTHNYISIAACLVLSIVASIPMGDAVRNRKPTKKLALSAAFAMSWMVLAVSSGLGSIDPLELRNSGLSLGLCLGGAVSIIASMKILWEFRKMGDYWEQNARPNPNPVVYNMGGPLFVFGWLLFFLGSSSVNAGESVAMSVDPAKDLAFTLPIFFNARTALAFFSGCGMVPIVMMLDNAHDDGGKFVGFGTDGGHFGRFWETPIPFLTAWTLFGLSSFLTLDNHFDLTTPHLAILGLCAAIGVDAGVLIQTALYEGDMQRKNIFSIPFVLLFIALAVNMGLGPDFDIENLQAGGAAMAFAIPGAALCVAGQKTVFGDRIRGDYWMENKQPNPNPNVYSYGEPLFMTGWIFMSIAMSLGF